jgi:hypothetical protein
MIYCLSISIISCLAVESLCPNHIAWQMQQMYISCKNKNVILSLVYVINSARHFKFAGDPKTPIAVRRTRVSRKILFFCRRSILNIVYKRQS